MNKLTKLTLAGSLALAGALGTYAAIDHYNTAQIQEENTEANRKLKNFPDKITGAEEVKKYETLGAKYTLVHVLQKHYVEMDDRKILETIMTNKEIESTNEVQSNIYDILKELRLKEIIDSVYLEGMDEKLIEQIKKSDRGFELLSQYEDYKTQELESDIYSLKFKANSIIFDLPEGLTVEQYRKNKLEEMSKKQKELKEYREKHSFVNGGAIKLIGEGVLIPKPAEKREAHDKAYEEYIRRGSIENLFDPRENILLDIITKEDNPLALTVYGADHSFKDNVEEWNKNHPDRKYSLIEVVPEGLEK